MTARLPTYFISHGGGPWPWLPDMRKMLAKLEASLADIPRQIGRKPKAILMVSGHWEQADFAVMANAAPPMVYDYHGFPPFTYQIQYGAPGSPEIAMRVKGLLEKAGLPTHADSTQGFDHGTFAPMAIMYPEADVPVFQVSIKHGYDPGLHLALGRALAPLRDEEVLIVGSGLSYHNLRRFGAAGREPSAQFDAWLDKAMNAKPAERTELLTHWEQAPAARIAHQEEDHLIPLMVAVGAAEQDKATRIYYDTDVFGGITASSYRFG